MISRSEKNKKVIKEINREKTIKISKIILRITIIISTLLIILYLYVRFIATSFIQTNEYIIRNADIPSSFHGIKMVHLSDILYGSTIDKDDLNYLKNEIDLINPDIIIFTGDLIIKNYEVNQEDIDYLKLFFTEIEARLGKYAIYGEMDDNTFKLIMNDTDFNILNNESSLIYNQENNPIMLIGLNINNITPVEVNNKDNNFTISLIHNYDYYNDFKIQSNIVLAGHNLNGEIKFPFTKGLLGDNKYSERYYQINDTIVYISNGLGSIHNMRLFNHPSINVYRFYNH